MKIQRIPAFISLMLLAACGGGGGGTGGAVAVIPTTQTVSGVVADGYLQGATACLDVNLNKKCDSGEPASTTGTGGAYSIAGVSIADLAKYPIVVEVPVGAVDSERGIVASRYVLTAPAGRPGFVSPLTTLVQYRIETGGLSLADAVAAVKTQLGLTTMSPLDDYKPGVSGAGTEAVLAAGVAKVVATALAGNLKAIETAVGIDETSVTTRQVLTLSVQQIIQNLSSVVLEVQTATGNGARVLAVDGVAGVVAGSGVLVNTSDTTVLRQQLAAAGTINSAASIKLTIALQGVGVTSVKALQATITLPAGVVIRTESNGKPLTGVFATAGSATSGLLDGKYTPATVTAPATLTIGFITTGTLSSGDVITINADLAAGTTAPGVSAFTVSSSRLIDGDSNTVSGVVLALR